MLNYATTPDCFNPAMEGGHWYQSTLGDTVTVLWTGKIDFHLHSPRPSSSSASGGVAWRVKHPLGCTADFLPRYVEDTRQDTCGSHTRDTWLCWGHVAMASVGIISRLESDSE